MLPAMVSKSRLGILAGVAALLALMSSKPASAAPPEPKPLSKETWRVTLVMTPSVPEDDTGEAEDAIRNGVSRAFAQVSGFVREYQGSDTRTVFNLLVEFLGAPSITVGHVFALPLGVKATVVSASRVAGFTKTV